MLGMMGFGIGCVLVFEIVFVFFVFFILYFVVLDFLWLLRIGYILVLFMIGGIVGLCIFVGVGLFLGYGGVGINLGRCIGLVVVFGGFMWIGYWVFWVGFGLLGVFMVVLYCNILFIYI